MKRNALLTLTGLLLAPLAALHAADMGKSDRVLVRVNYFAGWWEQPPNR